MVQVSAGVDGRSSWAAPCAIRSPDMLAAAGVILLLVLVQAFYVAAEFGAVSVRRSRLRRLAEDGNRMAARILPIVGDSRLLKPYVAAPQGGLTLSSLLVDRYQQTAHAPARAPV